MSTTDRPDLPEMGLQEASAVKGVFRAEDGQTFFIEKERCVLKKWDAKPDGTEWTTEQMDNGEAEQAGALAEVITTENGVIIDHWVRGEADGGG